MPLRTPACLCGVCHLVIVFLSCTFPLLAEDAEEDSGEENLAHYARYGAQVWSRNPAARISGESAACVSCHTSLPYALVEPLIPGNNPDYEEMIQNIDHRIHSWEENSPWYSEEKLERMAVLGGLRPDALKGILNGPDSRGTEAVLNLFIRAMHDAYEKKPASPETRLAFKHLWKEQLVSGPATGRWKWIKVNLIPWEGSDSDIWGAALTCVATSLYPELAPPGNLRSLVDSLKEASEDDEVSLHAKSAILWCDSEMDGAVLEEGDAVVLARKLLEVQREDGGWALRELGPWTGWEGSASDCCPKREIRSDTYATGATTVSLLRSRHLLQDREIKQLEKAMNWIAQVLRSPYPTTLRFNSHQSSDAELPEFRNHLIPNAGAMWAYLAQEIHSRQAAPWAID